MHYIFLRSFYEVQTHQRITGFKKRASFLHFLLYFLHFVILYTLHFLVYLLQSDIISASFERWPPAHK